MPDDTPKPKRPKQLPSIDKKSSGSGSNQDFWEDNTPEATHSKPVDASEILNDLEGLIEDSNNEEDILQANAPNLSNNPIFADTAAADSILEELDAHPAEPEQAETITDENTPKSATQQAEGLTNKAAAKPTKRSPIEMIASLACIAALVVLSVFFYQYLSKRFNVITEDKWVTNTPVKGDFAEINEIKTWWGSSTGNTKSGVKLAPHAQITLGAGTASGSLRIIFYSYEEDGFGNPTAKGDSIPLTFRNGVFSNGGKTITVIGTDGFKKRAYFYHYKNQDEDRWTVNILESASSQESGATFKPLAHAPIEPTLAQ